MGMQSSRGSAIIDSNKSYDSARREDLYNILIEFEIPMKLDRIKLIVGSGEVNICPTFSLLRMV